MSLRERVSGWPGIRQFLEAGRSTFGPTLRKERLARIRAPGAMGWFIGYTVLLALGCGTIYFLQDPAPVPRIGVGWQTGLPVFRDLAHLQAVLVLLVTPGLTCSVFSQISIGTPRTYVCASSSFALKNGPRYTA